MAKLFTRATVSGTTLSGANLKATLQALWDALNSGGFSDAARTTITTSTTLTTTQCGLLLVDASGGNIILTLPTSGTSTDDASYNIRRIDSSTSFTVTIQRGGTDTIEGGTSITAPPNSSTSIQIPGGSTNWRVQAISGPNATAARSAIGVQQIQTITATVSANALTIGVPAGSMDFRSASPGSGAVFGRSYPALSLVVPSGATLGSISGQTSRLLVILMDNAGTPELAVVNISGGNSLDETALITTSTISASANLNNGVYSTTGRANLAYRVVGFIESTQATAGTWATAPSTTQGYGGQALAAMSSFGYGQTVQAVTRVAGTTYYNLTGKPIFVSAQGTVTTSGYAFVQVNGTNWIGPQVAAGAVASVSAPVPPGGAFTYSSNVAITISSATELRN